mmetsp:Transcript_12225/g.33937  ORF Transcript_12225/g.33937 Transcript_12225/m.33937 type:complete len:218 (-) Transcript_12225:2158-2811(-)
MMYYKRCTKERIPQAKYLNNWGSFLSRSKKSLSIKSMILFLIVFTSGLNDELSCVTVSVMSSECFKTFLAFIILTIAASIWYLRSAWTISATFFFSCSTGGRGILILAILSWNLVLSSKMSVLLTVLPGGFFSKSLYLAQLRECKSLMTSASSSFSLSRTSPKLSFSSLLNSIMTAACIVFIWKLYFFSLGLPNRPERWHTPRVNTHVNFLCLVLRS